jgi:hypothetical protein
MIQQKEASMSQTVRGNLLWTPRVLGILMIAFVMLFSLDVFGTGAGFWETLLGFLIHNIPAFVLLIALILGWRWEWAGALGFCGFGIWYLLGVGGEDPVSNVLLGGLPLLIGALFLAAWIWRKRIR